LLRCALLRLGLVLVAVIAAPRLAPAQGGKIPNRPGQGTFTFDSAGILSAGALEQIARIQKTALEKLDTPIVVVTIGSRARYGGGGRSMGEFTKSWFDHWQIDRWGSGESKHKRGVLLMVSMGDRYVCIELGTDWGKNWRGFCDDLIYEQTVPEFTAGRFSTGVVHAVERLAWMAGEGPRVMPPGTGLLNELDRLARRWAFRRGPLPGTPPAIGLIFFAVGLVSIFGSLFSPTRRDLYLILGVSLSLAAVLHSVFVVAAGIAFLWFHGYRGLRPKLLQTKGRWHAESG
jgi:uncharacterized membrane protein YgcG